MNVVKIAVLPHRLLLFAALVGSLGCRAQVPAAGATVSPEVARRVEVLIRLKSNVPPNYTIEIGPRVKSELPGYGEITVVFIADGKASKPVHFLISDDNKTLAQISKFDISQDPRQLVSAAGRPARGGPVSAPVVIVGFDDLECPFCAKMHAELFPAILERYKDQVHVVYKDNPLDMHPWAMRGAIDANCLAAESSTAYWSMVDYVHLHASELGGAEKSLTKANDALDTIARDEGKRAKVNEMKLNACLAKQDPSPVQASMKEAETLGVDSAPALFINGEKFEGAYPVTDVYRMIDAALVAQGKVPPPAPSTAQPPVKPGS